MKLRWAFVATAVLGFGALVGANAGAGEASKDAESVIKSKLIAAAPQLPITSVKPSAFKGLYEVKLGNGERLFASEDGSHFIAGDMFAVKAEGLVNLTQVQRDQVVAQKMTTVSDQQKIVFSPSERKASITVFTDIDCGYCRRLHQQMDQYLAKGIEVKYMAFPRAGIDSPSYDKAVSAWCADDRLEAMTRLKTGQSVEQKTCVNPVADHYRLGGEIGIRGTPALVLEDGRVIAGYVEPNKLAQMLGI